MSFTLLLADDSVTTHRVIELTFAGHDIRVVSVTDGEQAVERMRIVHPDIVLAEVALPRVDGYRIAEHVRSTPALAGVPVLLLTGAFDVVDEPRVRASGAVGIIVKPFEPEVVIKRVKDLLGISSKEPEPPNSRLVTPAELPQRSTGPRGAGPPRPASQPPASAPEATSVTGAAAPLDQVGQPSLVVRGRAEIGRPASSYNGSFDELDEAFEGLDKQLSPRPAGRTDHHPAAPLVAPTPGSSSAAEPPVFEFDEAWFNAAGRPSGSNLSPAPVTPPVTATYSGHCANDTAGAPVAPVLPGAPVAIGASGATGMGLPDVADTFQALLAAEQGGPIPVGTRETVVISDDAVERIAARVAERLSEGAFVDMVAQIVNTVAERLVREEIARIRSKVEAKKS